MVLESYLRDMASEFYVDPEEDSEGADQRRFTQLEKNQPGWPSIGGEYGCQAWDTLPTLQEKSYSWAEFVAQC